MNTFKKRFLIAGVLIGGFFLFGSAGKAEAQSFTLSPASGTVTVGGTQAIDIIATNPPATGSASIRITVPGSLLNVTGYSDGVGTLTFGACSGNSYTTTQVCADVALSGPGNFTNGQVLGTFTVQGIANGVANVGFVANNKYYGQADYTGTGATFTVGSGGGSPVDGVGAVSGEQLPSTGVFDDKNFLWYGLTLVSGGFLVYSFNKKRTQKALNHSMIDHFFEKNRLG